MPFWSNGGVARRAAHYISQVLGYKFVRYCPHKFFTMPASGLDGNAVVAKPTGKTGYGGNVKPINGAVSKVDFLIDLRSDTVTRPNAEMRQWIANAEVGDDVFEEDFTVKELERRVAELLGKEAGLFVASGTMGNLIALLVHCPARGSEILVGDKSHIFKYEQGGMAQFGGIQANKIRNNADGTFSIDEIKQNIREDDDHCPITALLCLENTHNVCGGRVLPQSWIDEVTELAREHKIPVHMDGARLFNAVIATGVPASRIVRDIQSVNICLSKGLGTPMGSVLVGSEDFIRQSRRLRKALGGGMRQIGMMAAAGLYALEKNLPRLGEDHTNAKLVAHAIAAFNNPLFTVNPDDVQSNIFMVHMKYPISEAFCTRIQQVSVKEVADLGSAIGILLFPWTDSSVRLVLHCDVTGELVQKAVQKLCYVMTEFKNSVTE